MVEQVRDPRCHEIDLRRRGDRSCDTVLDDVADGADGKAHHRAASHVRFNGDTGDALSSTGDQGDVDSTEHQFRVLSVAEHGHVVGEVELRYAALDCCPTMALARHDEMGAMAGEPHSCQDIDGQLRLLLVDEVSDEAEERHIRADSDLQSQHDRRVRPVDADEPLRIAGVGDQPDWPVVAEIAHLGLHVGCESDDAVEASRDRVPGESPEPAPVLNRQAQDALPDADRRGPNGERHDDGGPPTVGENEISGVLGEVAANAPAAPQIGGEPEPSRRYEDREVSLGLPIRGESDGEYFVRVTKCVEGGG